VIIDHGLYTPLSPEFREQYSELWRGLMIQDFDKVKGIAREWGVRDEEIFGERFIPSLSIRIRVYLTYRVMG
jgi:predicted unusual protein kinase regulating ubiquinone biosynthesis (AarF/ABC1/UbiB family)